MDLPFETRNWSGRRPLPVRDRLEDPSRRNTESRPALQQTGLAIFATRGAIVGRYWHRFHLTSIRHSRIAQRARRSPHFDLRKRRKRRWAL